MVGMKKVVIFADMGTATAEVVGRCRLRDGGQVQDFKASLRFQEIANEVVDVDSLHHDDETLGHLLPRETEERAGAGSLWEINKSNAAIAGER
jgi:hypothetical protein